MPPVDHNRNNWPAAMDNRSVFTKDNFKYYSKTFRSIIVRLRFARLYAGVSTIENWNLWLILHEELHKLLLQEIYSEPTDISLQSLHVREKRKVCPVPEKLQTCRSKFLYVQHT